MLHRIRQSIVFGLCFFAALVGVDIYCQFAEVECPMEEKLDPRVGLLYLPNFKFSRFSEGFYLGWTNEYGCLGRGAPRQRDGKTIRILFLGDSFPLGHTVFDRHHFARGIEEVAARGAGRPVEVLNFARADFALTNEYQHYCDFASQWHPDLALFLVDQSDLDPARPASGSFYPTALVEADTLAYEYSFVHSWKAQTFQKYALILNHSVIPNLVFEFLKRRDQGELPHLFLGKLRPARPPEPTPLDNVAYKDPAKPMPATTRLVLERLAHTPRVAVVLSGPTHPDYAQAVRDLGIPLVDLNPVFADLRARGIDPYYWPVTNQRGHWNQETHRAIGEALGKASLDLLRAIGNGGQSVAR